MPSVEAAASGLKQCLLAQDQLEGAISSVMKAEQQLRDNAREVSIFIILLLFIMLCLPVYLSVYLFVYNFQS